MQFCKAFKLVFALTLLQLSFLFAQDEGSSFQQVPVCAPIAPSGSQVASTMRGGKGDQGFPGKFGAKGDKGRAGDKGEAGYNTQSGARCPGVTFNLPRDNQNTDYVRYRAYVPSMKESTMCAWIEAHRASDFNDYSTILSYAVPAFTNELLLMFQSSRIMNIPIQQGSITLGMPKLNETQKHHICLSLSPRSEEIALYINSSKVATSNHQHGSLRGGGVLILGQDQDAYDAGNLDASQSFSGKITNLMIWPRILSDQEISNIASNCECPRDFAVAMTMDKTELHGQAEYSYSDECPTL